MRILDKVPSTIDRKVTLGVFILYSLLRLPLVIDSIPGWYRAAVQFTTIKVAISTAKHGIPPEFVFGQSFAGANLHGILAVPIVIAGLDLRFIRFEMFLLGLLTLVIFYYLLQFFKFTDRATIVGILFLTVTPHFVLFTGYAINIAFTLMFSVASIATYTKYLTSSRLRWAIASGVFAGLAAFNHFWGGIATLTILGFDLVVIGWLTHQRRTQEILQLICNRAPIWGAHFLALLPTAYLFYYFRTGLTGEAKRIFEHYGGYSIIDAPHSFLNISWYLTMLEWAIIYQPITLAGFIISAFILHELRNRNVNVVQHIGNQTIVSIPVFWSVWFAFGAFIVVLLPEGARIHDYYLWWCLPATIGLVTWWINTTHSRDNGMLRRAGVLVLAILLISSLVVSSGMAILGPVDRHDFPAPVASVLGGGQERDASNHANALEPVLENEIGANERVLIYGGREIETALVELYIVEINRVTYHGRGMEFESADAAGHDVVVSHRDLSNTLPAGWSEVERVEGGGYTSYIYHQNDNGA